MAQFGKAQQAQTVTFGKRAQSVPEQRFPQRPQKQAPELSPQALAFLEGERQTSGASQSFGRDSQKRNAAANVSDFVYAPAASDGRAAGKPVWGRRIIATLIDSFITGVPVFLFFGFGIMGAAMTQGTAEAMIGGMFILALVLAVVSAIYAISMEASSKQATWGKMAVGAIVVDKDGGKPGFGAIVLRNTLGRFGTNIIPFYIGYFMGLARQDRRCLHDLIAGTMVCEKSTRNLAYESTFR